MAKTVEKYYKLNVDDKIVTINSKAKPTQTDLDIVQLYVNAGYIIRVKSEARAKAARENAKKHGFGKKKKAEAATEEK